MAFLKQSAVALVVLLLMIDEGAGLRCYQCSGGGNSVCNDPPKLDGTDLHQLCKDNESVCLKVKYNNNVERRCAADVVLGIKICDTLYSHQECATCDTDLCNSSNNMNASLALIVLSAFYFFY